MIGAASGRNRGNCSASVRNPPGSDRDRTAAGIIYRTIVRESSGSPGYAARIGIYLAVQPS